MNNKFDELAKGLAQSVTRRQAFKKFGVGLAGMALTCFGLADKAHATRTCVDKFDLCNPNSPYPNGGCCRNTTCQEQIGRNGGIVFTCR